MITDLHCHYPMHLVHAELEPASARSSWWKRAREGLEQATFDLAALLFNDPGWSDRWRVDLEGLRAGGVGTVCSVLYWPGAELLPTGGTHPLPGSFEHLVTQLEDVEKHLTARSSSSASPTSIAATFASSTASRAASTSAPTRDRSRGTWPRCRRAASSTSRSPTSSRGASPPTRRRSPC